LSPLEEVAVEDKTIRHEISVLSAYIEQHAVKFYRSQSDSKGIPIRRLIAEYIIDNVIEGTMNGTVTLPPSFSIITQLWTQVHNAEGEAAEKLSRDLEQYSENPSDQDRYDHIQILCELARRIQQITRDHPSEWRFGGWNVGPGVQFPGVFMNEDEVLPPEFD
jgi:hypothetical protein